MSGTQSSTLTCGFIDLATFDEMEKYSYGGLTATAYFCRETKKSTWFTQIPVVLSKASGQANFGNEWSVTISRAGDYLLNTWLRVVVPDISFSKNHKGQEYALGFTPNFMHNLVCECAITFNDLVAARFDNYSLDFWAAFTTPSSKAAGYNEMIGNHPDFVFNSTGKISGRVLNLPLPFFYSRDCGVALPTAALPYNDMRITFNFRRLTDLLQVYRLTGAVYEPVQSSTHNTILKDLLGKDPTTIQLNCNVWANYAVASNDERKRMSCAPRDILIEQVQTTPALEYLPKSNGTATYDIRFSHSVKVFFFGMPNTTYPAVHSNYSTGTFVGNNQHGLQCHENTVFDPMASASLLYENTYRLSNMSSDYYSLINPYYHAPSVPAQDTPFAVVGASPVGYHTYSYSLDFYNLDPMGSTNFGKLTNVSVNVSYSQKSVDSVVDYETHWPQQQTYKFVLSCINNNIIRISGGALGFPVL